MDAEPETCLYLRVSTCESRRCISIKRTLPLLATIAVEAVESMGNYESRSVHLKPKTAESRYGGAAIFETIGRELPTKSLRWLGKRAEVLADLARDSRRDECPRAA